MMSNRIFFESSWKIKSRPAVREKKMPRINYIRELRRGAIKHRCNVVKMQNHPCGNAIRAKSSLILRGRNTEMIFVDFFIVEGSQKENGIDNFSSRASRKPQRGICRFKQGGMSSQVVYTRVSFKADRTRPHQQPSQSLELPGSQKKIHRCHYFFVRCPPR